MEIQNLNLTPEETKVVTGYQGYEKLLTQIVNLKKVTFHKLFQLNDEIEALMNEHKMLWQMFSDEAVNMYPSLQGTNLKAYVPTLPAEHPLVLLKQQYQVRANEILSHINEAIEAEENVKKLDDELLAQEKAVLNEYASFRSSQTLPSSLPTPEEFYKKVKSLSSLNQVDHASTVVSMEALDLLSPEAAALVTIQAASTDMPEAKIDVGGTKIQAKSSPLITTNTLMLGTLAFLFYVFGSQKT